MTTYELEQAAQKAAEERLNAAYERLWSEEDGEAPHEDSPEWDEVGPFCGCDTCIVREVLDAAWPYLKELAAVVEQEDTGHSKWSASGRAGSSPASGTHSDYEEVQRLRRAIADHRVQWVEGINDAFAEDIRRINSRLWNAL